MQSAVPETSPPANPRWQSRQWGFVQNVLFPCPAPTYTIDSFPGELIWIPRYPERSPVASTCTSASGDDAKAASVSSSSASRTTLGRPPPQPPLGDAADDLHRESVGESRKDPSEGEREAEHEEMEQEEGLQGESEDEAYHSLSQRSHNDTPQPSKTAPEVLESSPPAPATVEAEETVPCLLLTYESARFIMIFFHSNAEDLGKCRWFCHFLRDQFQVHVLAVEYPGYGVCPGPVCKEGVLANAHAAMHFTTQVLKWPLEQVKVFGRSIGTGPAFALAAKYAVAGLIVVTPFLSIRALFRDKVGPLARFVEEWFPNDEAIREVRSPTLFVHGRRDMIIPWHHSEALFAACQTRKLFISPAGMEHNTNLTTDISFLIVPMFRFFSLPDYCFVELPVPAWAYDKRRSPLYKRKNEQVLSHSSAPPGAFGAGLEMPVGDDREAHDVIEDVVPARTFGKFLEVSSALPAGGSGPSSNAAMTSAHGPRSSPQSCALVGSPRELTPWPEGTDHEDAARSAAAAATAVLAAHDARFTSPPVLSALLTQPTVLHDYNPTKRRYDFSCTKMPPQDSCTGDDEEGQFNTQLLRRSPLGAHYSASRPSPLHENTDVSWAPSEEEPTCLPAFPARMVPAVPVSFAMKGASRGSAASAVGALRPAAFHSQHDAPPISPRSWGESVQRDGTESTMPHCSDAAVDDNPAGTSPRSSDGGGQRKVTAASLLQCEFDELEDEFSRLDDGAPRKHAESTVSPGCGAKPTGPECGDYIGHPPARSTDGVGTRASAAFTVQQCGDDVTSPSPPRFVGPLIVASALEAKTPSRRPSPSADPMQLPAEPCPCRPAPRPSAKPMPLCDASPEISDVDSPTSADASEPAGARDGGQGPTVASPQQASLNSWTASAEGLRPVVPRSLVTATKGLCSDHRFPCGGGALEVCSGASRAQAPAVVDWE